MSGRDEREGFDVICLSLEPWDEVWRRNQHLATELLRLRPAMRLLFVELAIDVTWSLRHGRWPRASPLRPVGDTGRLWVMAPRKWLPRRVWAGVDDYLIRQVLAAARRLEFHRPLLWINDSMYAPMLQLTSWPSVYDVTDDWLLAQTSSTEYERQRKNDALMLRDAAEVVVCSPSLLASRGQNRQVHLIPNGVDVEYLRSPTSRPADLPAGRVVMYQGTLDAGRLDVALCLRLGASLGQKATFVLLGPNSLSRESTTALKDVGTVILGGRPYTDVPGYLQHADVLVVPHRVTPFTESLDPIKVREFQAVPARSWPHRWPVLGSGATGHRGQGGGLRRSGTAPPRHGSGIIGSRENGERTSDVDVAGCRLLGCTRCRRRPAKG